MSTQNTVTASGVPETVPTDEVAGAEINNGPAVAAFIAAGIGCLTMGIVTTLAEASADFANLLRWNSGVGPLSGKTLVTVIVWLLAWAGLHFAWRGKQFDFGRMFLITLILVGLGVLGTFPLFFDLFAPA